MMRAVWAVGLVALGPLLYAQETTTTVPTTPTTAATNTTTVRTSYHVKQIATGAVYLDGGSDDGLKEGMHLKVTRDAAPGAAQMSRKEIGDVVVVAVATISAVCEVKEGGQPIEIGDNADLSYEDTQSIQLVRSSKTIRHVAQTVSFTEGDPLDEELRAYVPHNPSPEVNKSRGMIGFQQMAVFDHSTGMRTMEEGLVMRMDLTRIAGTYWSFTGYWNGQISNTGGVAQVQTINDLVNRTYTLGFYYNNPNSPYVIGIGRLLLPWAPSLSSIDGGYFARREGKHFTTGIFAGSTPNPTAWNYDPGQERVGTFVAYETGSYETVRFSSTGGAAVDRSHWHPERQFLFFENTLTIGKKLTFYDDTEADKLAAALTTTGVSQPRLARNFATLRIQPLKRLELEFAHNYFRDVPTFDLRLLGTGLLDQYLFQGFSGGTRIDVFRGIQLYGNLGRSRAAGDVQPALNYMGGLRLPHLPSLPELPGLPRIKLPLLPALPHISGLPALPNLAVQTDLRYSKFANSFARGSYASITLSRQFTDKIRLDLQGGEQTLVSPFTSQTRTKFVNNMLDYLIGRHYLLGVGWTFYHGGAENYDQTFVTFGYRF